MKKNILKFAVIIASIVIAACSSETLISYNKSVKPIFEENCFPCHQAGGKGEVASGLNLETYENLMRGTKLGPVIQTGLSYASTLHVLVEHKAAAEINMPRGGNKLPKKDIEIIGKWIDQGAKNN